MNKTLADIFLESYNGLELPEEISERFTVMERLSENEMGETYLLSENSSGKQYVIKSYRKSEMTGRDSEAEILKGLRHKGLPRLRAEIENEDALLVMREYAAGVTLNQFISERGVMSAAMTVRVSQELCEILTFLHTQPEPIIHRDIKPSNIIIDQDAWASRPRSGRPVPEDNGVKLIDFGISRRYSEDAEEDTVSFGTKKYAAPEQYGFKQTDGRSDIFSLGVVMRFMLTGSPDGEVADAALKTIIDKCTEFSPDDRYQSAAALKRALGRYRHNAKRRAASVSLSILTLFIAIAMGFAVGRYTELFSIPFLEAPGTKPYVFVEPLIEEAVRLMLGKADEEPLFQADLDLVAELFIDGAKVRRSSDEYFSMFEPQQYGTIISLDDLREMPNLRRIFIKGQHLTDVSPLAECKLLEWIELPQCPISDISPLAALSRLTNLGLADTDISDFSALAEIKALRFLAVYTPVFTDINMLRAYQLDNLNLHSAKISSLDGIEGYAALTQLSVAHTGVQDFSPLNGITTLMTLNISRDMEQYLPTLARDDVQVIISD